MASKYCPAPACPAPASPAPACPAAASPPTPPPPPPPAQQQQQQQPLVMMMSPSVPDGPVTPTSGAGLDYDAQQAHAQWDPQSCSGLDATQTPARAHIKPGGCRGHFGYLQPDGRTIVAPVCEYPKVRYLNRTPDQSGGRASHGARERNAVTLNCVVEFEQGGLVCREREQGVELWRTARIPQCPQRESAPLLPCEAVCDETRFPPQIGYDPITRSAVQRSTTGRATVAVCNMQKEGWCKQIWLTLWPGTPHEYKVQFICGLWDARTGNGQPNIAQTAPVPQQLGPTPVPGPVVNSAPLGPAPAAAHVQLQVQQVSNHNLWSAEGALMEDPFSNAQEQALTIG